jgi:hypothetical protein
MENSLVTVEKVISAQTVNGAATVSSSAIRVSYGQNFGVYVKLAGTTPVVTIRYQVINSDCNDINMINAGEDSHTEWITPTTGSDIMTAITATAADGFSPMVSKWIRIQVVGVGANGANTVANVYLSSFIA